MALEQVGVRAVIEGVASFNRGLRDMKREIISVGDAGMTAAKRTETFNKALKVTGTALVAASGAAGALLYSSVKLAARVETLGIVTEVLGRNVGKSKQEIRDLEQAVKDQGITLQGARTAIALMIQSNIDLSHAVDLAAEAQDAAVIAGVNSTEAFERLVYTITSGNVRMARTLGLQVSFQGAYERTAASIGKTVTALTEEEKVQARTNEVIRAGVNIVGAYDAAMESAGKKVTSLPRHLEESKRMLGEAWLPVYADVIDFITKSLEKWESLSQVKKDIISKTFGMVAAFGLIVGVISLVASKVSAAVAAFQTLATAIAGQGTLVFSANMVLGIYAAALLAVVAAAVKVVQTINMIKTNMQNLRDVYAKHNEDMFQTASTYEEYRNEMIRAGLLVARNTLNAREYNRAMKEGGEEAVLAAAGVEFLSEKQFNLHRALMGTAESGDEVARKMEIMRGNMLDLRDTSVELGRSQEELQADLDKLGKTIDLNITEQFTDYKDRVEELNKKIAELEAIKEPTKDQREDLEKTRKELVDTQRQWDKTTSRIIFDLAEQRLAIDGWTEDEVAALRELAGPEGLGLIDESAVKLLEQIDRVAAGLDIGVISAGEFSDQIVDLQLPLQDSTREADNLARAIRDIRSKSVTVTATVALRYEQGGGSGLIRSVLGFQHGGNPPVGRPSVVGERGPELIVPRGPSTVLSNRFLGAITSLITAIKSAPMMATAPAVAPSMVSNSYSNQYNLNVNTQAPIEPIIGDFRAMQAMSPF